MPKKRKKRRRKPDPCQEVLAETIALLVAAGPPLRNSIGHAAMTMNRNEFYRLCCGGDFPDEKEESP